MKKCEKCLTADIGDQYKYCIDCNNKMKAELTQGGGDIVKAIGAVNNNLFFIRRYLEWQLSLKGRELKWSAEKKDFLLSKAKK